jgi:hypothetical protein
MSSVACRLSEKCLTGITPSSPMFFPQVFLFISAREPINAAAVKRDNAQRIKLFIE